MFHDPLQEGVSDGQEASKVPIRTAIQVNSNLTASLLLETWLLSATPVLCLM